MGKKIKNNELSFFLDYGTFYLYKIFGLPKKIPKYTKLKRIFQSIEVGYAISNSKSVIGLNF